jgi:hypothetical protein
MSRPPQSKENIVDIPFIKKTGLLLNPWLDVGFSLDAMT